LRSNPFSTRFIRPSAARYVFPAGTNADSLIAGLEQTGWIGEIIGPHGSGKSTLVQTLLPHLKEAGRALEFYSLHEFQRRMPADQLKAVQWTSRTQIVVDGYEQLGFLQRIRLRRKCRKWHAGLLVTAHAPTGLPLLCRTETSRELARQIVAGLLADDDDMQIGPEEADLAFVETGGNLREMLLRLYDVFEQRNAAS
jgi:hypothetical protein